MTTDSPVLSISAADAPFTVINRFVPTPDDVDELVSVLAAGIADEMSIQPGFVSAAIHRSADSPDVLVYGQWESADALAAAGEVVQSGGAPNMARGFELGRPEYHPYEITAVISRSRRARA